MNASILLFMVVVIIGSTTAQFYGVDPYRQYGGYRPYRPSYGGGYRPSYGHYRPPGAYYGGYPGDHHHHHHHNHHNHGYPVDGGYVPNQGGVAPAPVAPVAVNPSGALAPGSANAGGAGTGAIQNGQAIGTGTGVANAGPGGFGIGLGIGLAVATPLGNIALGEGNSVSVGKK
ncbi:hypothetical protein GHT06_022407 [Daphnia sinensis]|uniref:Uncharacterized protein n=1 Tax=Daphnia sinensis TaxID=1820382 RepID=A0AAD5KX40_9CRUS|nr:hypothetical protein GHT06_022407 [Daphnia sinensis]